jgi:hypothetical protein
VFDAGARWHNTVMSESGGISVGNFTNRDEILWRIEELRVGDVKTIDVCKDGFLIACTLWFDDTLRMLANSVICYGERASRTVPLEDLF